MKLTDREAFLLFCVTCEQVALDELERRRKRAEQEKQKTAIEEGQPQPITTE